MPRLSRRTFAQLRWAAVGLHAFIVGAMLALFYAAAPIPEGDANIGKGLVGTALQGLGLPWTLLIFLFDPSTYNRLTPFVRGVVDFGPAVLNVVLHVFLPTVCGRFTRARRRAAQPG